MIKPEDLVVTAFSQTSFIQRYHDSLNSEQQHIRRLVEEALNLRAEVTTPGGTVIDEHNEADDVILGFENDVPDHLPTSPLCPLHPKHASKGRGICPMHGYKGRNGARRSAAALSSYTDAAALAPLALRESPPSAAAAAAQAIRPTVKQLNSRSSDTSAALRVASTQPPPRKKYRHRVEIVYDSRFGSDGAMTEKGNGMGVLDLIAICA
jgi:hypothetical protein